MEIQANKDPASADHHSIVDVGELTVEVFAPRVSEFKKFTWSKSLQVGKAADEAAKAFQYAAGNSTFLNKSKQVLDREKTLVEAGVRDFDQLELTDKGGGV